MSKKIQLDKKTVRKDIRFLMNHIYTTISIAHQLEDENSGEYYKIYPGMINRMIFMDIRMVEKSSVGI